MSAKVLVVGACVILLLGKIVAAYGHTPHRDIDASGLHVASLVLFVMALAAIKPDKSP